MPNKKPTSLPPEPTKKRDESTVPLYESEQTDTDTLPTPPPKDESDGGED